MKKIIILLAFLVQMFAQDLIKVGMSPGFAPFGYIKDDKVAGFDIDLVNEIANILGIKIEFIPMDFDALMGALKLGKINVIASGLSNTPARAKNVEFSKIYYRSQNYALKKSSRKDIDKLEGLEIGVQLGSIQAALVEKTPNTKAFLNPEISNLFLALINGKVDAVIVDKMVAKGYLQTYKELEVFQKIVEENDGVSFAFQKGNFKLKNDFDYALDELIKNGKYDELLKKYDM